MVNSTTDNIPQSNTKINSDTSSTKYSMQDTKKDTQELDNSSFSKSKNIIQKLFKKKSDSNTGVIPQDYNPSSELTNEIENKTKINMKKYSNIEFINIDDLLKLAKNGGHRTQEQVNSLIENIKKNGITEPIELVKNNDETLEIENDNHRLLIAKMFDLKTIPVKYSKSLFEILEKNIDVSYNQIGNDKYGNESASGKISGNNAQSEYFIRSGNGIIEYAKNGRADTRDARLHNKVRGYNNRSSNSTATSRDTLWGQELASIKVGKGTRQTLLKIIRVL